MAVKLFWLGSRSWRPRALVFPGGSPPAGLLWDCRLAVEDRGSPGCALPLSLPVGSRSGPDKGETIPTEVQAHPGIEPACAPNISPTDLATSHAPTCGMNGAMPWLHPLAACGARGQAWFVPCTMPLSQFGPWPGFPGGALVSGPPLVKRLLISTCWQICPADVAFRPRDSNMGRSGEGRVS